MMRYCYLFIFSIFILVCHPNPLPYVSDEITAVELCEHVRYLASDELEGRASGTQGNEMAARYIAEQFSSYGLQPMGDNGTYYQSFQVLTGLQAGSKNQINLSIGEKSLSLKLRVDFIPLSFSSDTTITSSLVFAGYGISADSLHYDDYAKIDVRGKIVLVLRYSPDYGKPDSKFYEHAPLYRKAFVAREKGASGMMLVTGPADEEKPALIPLRAERSLSSSGIPAVNIKSTTVDSMLRWAGIDKNLRTLQQEIYDTKSPHSFEIPNAIVRMQTQIVKVYSSTSNVIGYLEGSDPQLKDEVIVVGAHFDHVGWGGTGSGSLQPDTTAIHNGADDNASGTSALLELAQAIAANRHVTKRSYLFTAFSGEELGLLGSAHYVKYPSIPLEKTIAMINIDMVGRLRDSSFIIEGIGTSPIWKPIIEKENTAFNFKLKLGQGGLGPSDHASFYGKNIPTLLFFTGLHQDYHRHSDDWDKINYDGERDIAQYVLQIVKTLDESEKPTFTRVQTTASDTAMRRGFRVTLGIIPDYSEGNEGLKISGTRPAGPAEKAGLKSGDIITKFGGKDLRSIYDLTYLLGKYNPGDEVDVIFKRDGETKSITVKLEARQ